MVFFPLLPLLINGYQDLYNSPMGFLIDGDALHHIAILQVSYVACFYFPLLPRTCRLPIADVLASYPPLRFLAPVVYLSPMSRRVTLLYASSHLSFTSRRCTGELPSSTLPCACAIPYISRTRMRGAQAGSGHRRGAAGSRLPDYPGYPAECRYPERVLLPSAVDRSCTRLR